MHVFQVHNDGNDGVDMGVIFGTLHAHDGADRVTPGGAGAGGVESVVSEGGHLSHKQNTTDCSRPTSASLSPQK